MDYLHSTEAELDINLDIPLSMQDPLDKLNVANKKRKHADDIYDYFKETKRLKSSAKEVPPPSISDNLLKLLRMKKCKMYSIFNTVKENQEKDKIGSKPDKIGKRGEAGKSLK
nr:hypothetical protein [Tanacetum cinerariifolium]